LQRFPGQTSSPGVQWLAEQKTGNIRFREVLGVKVKQFTLNVGERHSSVRVEKRVMSPPG